MFENFIISNHIMKRYLQRVGCKKRDVLVRIKRDVHFTKVNQIINIGKDRHIFARNGKEFIFVKSGSVWILKTIIKRTRYENEKAIEKRLNEQEKVRG